MLIEQVMGGCMKLSVGTPATLCNVYVYVSEPVRLYGSFMVTRAPLHLSKMTQTIMSIIQSNANDTLRK